MHYVIALKSLSFILAIYTRLNILKVQLLDSDTVLDINVIESVTFANTLVIAIKFIIMFAIIFVIIFIALFVTLFIVNYTVELKEAYKGWFIEVATKEFKTVILN